MAVFLANFSGSSVTELLTVLSHFGAAVEYGSQDLRHPGHGREDVVGLALSQEGPGAATILWRAGPVAGGTERVGALRCQVQGPLDSDVVAPQVVEVVVVGLRVV
jgi:hypothetical protein